MRGRACNIAASHHKCAEATGGLGLGNTFQLGSWRTSRTCEQACSRDETVFIGPFWALTQTSGMTPPTGLASCTHTSSLNRCRNSVKPLRKSNLEVSDAGVNPGQRHQLKPLSLIIEVSGPPSSTTTNSSSKVAVGRSPDEFTAHCSAPDDASTSAHRVKSPKSNPIWTEGSDGKPSVRLAHTCVRHASPPALL